MKDKIKIIQRSSVRAKGFGKTKFVVSNDTAERRQQNRWR
jgi:outer membrane protein OmpA-like peptidoglycan-associated protein